MALEDIADNAGSLINYGERLRAGERISSSLAESTMNAAIGKRFAQRQPMQGTPRCALLLLQTRTRALDGTLRPVFERWYPASPMTTMPTLSGSQRGRPTDPDALPTPRRARRIGLSHGSRLVDMDAAEDTHEPEYYENNQYQAKNAAEARPAIAIVTIVSAATSQQQNQQDDNNDHTHYSPLWQNSVSAICPM
jgi:hypothetical protein